MYVPLYQCMPRRVSINSRRGANSCRWNARWSQGEREVVRLCVPFVRPATGFPIGDSSLIRRRRVSNRARPNDHLGCVIRLRLHRAKYVDRLSLSSFSSFSRPSRTRRSVMIFTENRSRSLTSRTTISLSFSLSLSLFFCFFLLFSSRRDNERSVIWNFNASEMRMFENDNLGNEIRIPFSVVSHSLGIYQMKFIWWRVLF